MVHSLLNRPSLIWIKAHAREKDQHPHCHNGVREVCNMHDVMGNAGMLHGWIAIWTMQMVWLVTAMIVAAGVTATAELLITRRGHRAQAELPMRSASAADPRSR
jgi:hypothetical protein